jgi:hypothetical protein
MLLEEQLHIEHGENDTKDVDNVWVDKMCQGFDLIVHKSSLIHLERTSLHQFHGHNLVIGPKKPSQHLPECTLTQNLLGPEASVLLIIECPWTPCAAGQGTSRQAVWSQPFPTNGWRFAAWGPTTG